MSRLFFLVFFLFSGSVHSEENPFDNPAAIYSMCAAANAILSTQMDDGMFKEMISSEAARHASLARAAGASEKDLRDFVEAMGAAYNSGEMSWEEISNLGQECTSL